MGKLTERQKKLSELVIEIDELYGAGNGYVYEDTDVDKFIEEFFYELTVNIGMAYLFDDIAEGSHKTYRERFNEI